MAQKRTATKVNMTNNKSTRKETTTPEPEDEGLLEVSDDMQEMLTKVEPELVLPLDEEIDDEDLDTLSPEELIIRVEELDPSTELFEGGPTAGQVTKWKRQHGAVYLTAIDYETYIIWRPITRGEYRNHVTSMADLSASGRVSEAEVTLINEDVICELCTLYPKMNAASMEGEMAGVPALITQQVMEASGFMALEVRQL